MLYDTRTRMQIPEPLFESIARVFWDVDPGALDFDAHRDFIIGRVLMEGDWNAVQALRKHVSDAELAAFARRSGRRLDLRTRRFLEAVLNLEPSRCDSTSLKQLNAMPFRR